MIYYVVARWRAFLLRESAISITEYGMLVAFIAFVIIAVVVLFGSGMSAWFAGKTGTITTV
jgi:pilus assembly protein Flp/PilA